MKKSLLYIVLVLACRFTMLAQNYEISASAQKYMDRAEMAMEMVKEPVDYQKVISELQKALAEAPNHPIIIYNLGICYDGMGMLEAINYKKAIEYYKQFLTLNPNEEDRKDVVSRINKAEYAIEETTSKKQETNRQKQQEIDDMFGKYLGEWKCYFMSPSDLTTKYGYPIWFFMEGDALKVKFSLKYYWYLGERNIIPKEYGVADVFLTENGIRFTVSMFEIGYKRQEDGDYEAHNLHQNITYNLSSQNGMLVGTYTCNSHSLVMQERGKRNNFKYKILSEARRKGNTFTFPSQFAIGSGNTNFVR